MNAGMNANAPAAETPAPQQQQPFEQPAPPPPPPAPSYAPPYSPGMNTEPAKGSRHAVAGVWGYIGMMIVFGIPLVGFIFCIVWSFSRSMNLNRRNFARANLILRVIALIFSVLLLILFGAFLAAAWGDILYHFDGQFSWQDFMNEFK